MRNKKLTLKFVLMGFYPDYTATGELLYEIGVKLVENNDINLSVLTAQPSFVKKAKLPGLEISNGLKIKRLNIINLNKNSFLGKIFNAYSFFFRALIDLTFSKKSDWLLIPTSPPLLPLAGLWTKILKKQRYICLLEDIYPEIAWKLGYIKKDGIICKIWDYLQKLSIKHADKVIVLSEDMETYLLNWCTGLNRNKIALIPHHANEELIKPISKSENYFLDKYNLKNKFIVEYSGNIGRIHDFSAILNAAYELREENDILFVFIGDGGKKQEIEDHIHKYNLKNILLLPYQERSELAYSLGIADIHLITLANGYETLAAPSKLYGILAAGKPFIYIGKGNYLTKTAQENNCGYFIGLNEHKILAEKIIQLKNSPQALLELGSNSRKLFEENFTLEKISRRYFELL